MSASLRGCRRRAADAARAGLDVRHLGRSLVRPADQSAGAPQLGRARVGAAELVLDQGANHQLGRYGLELGADRAEEVRAAAGHDADGGFSSAEFVDHLEHREVAHPARVVTQHRVPRPPGEVANQLGELLGSQIGEQIRERDRDAG